MVEQIRVNVMDDVVTVDNRDINTTWIWVYGVKFEVERSYLEHIWKMSGVNHIMREENIDLLLDEDGIVYLLDNMRENNPVDSKVHLELPYKERLLRWCVEYVHAMCVDDSGTLDTVMEMTDLDEGVLMGTFDVLASDNGFALEKKVDGVWVKTLPPGVGMTTYEMEEEYRNSQGVEKVMLHEGMLTDAQLKEVARIYGSFLHVGDGFEVEVATGTYDMILESVLRRHISVHFGIDMNNDIYDSLIDQLDKMGEVVVVRD